MNAHIQIVGLNHRQHLADCLQSCLRQTVKVPVLYIDNASADGSTEFVRETFPEVSVFVNDRNRGYSGGHNDGFRAAPDTAVVVVLNPDVVLAPDFVEKGLRAFTHERVGAVAPLLLRATANREQQTGNDVVDAYGTVLLPSLRAVNQFEGHRVPSSQFAVMSWPQPWGFTGAAAFLRRAALHDVALEGEIFDEDLFAYREDVDLSWRLRGRGWDIVGAPEARATHARAARSGTAKDSLVLQLSWQNYYLVLLKNAPVRTLLKHFPWILLEDFARDLQFVVTPRLWPALPQMVRLLPRFTQKRSAVFRLRR